MEKELLHKEKEQEQSKRKCKEATTPVVVNTDDVPTSILSSTEKENVLSTIASRGRYNLRKRNLREEDIQTEINNDINFCAIEGVSLANRFETLSNADNEEVSDASNQNAAPNQNQPMEISPVHTGESRRSSLESHPPEYFTGDEASVGGTQEQLRKKRHTKKRNSARKATESIPEGQESSSSSTSSSSSSEEEDNAVNTTDRNQNSRPPPFILYEFNQNPEDFKDILAKKGIRNIRMKISYNSLKIMVNSIEDFRKLQSFLDEKNYNYILIH